MSFQNEPILENFEDGLNANAGTNTNIEKTDVVVGTSDIDSKSNSDATDKNDKLDYLNVDSDGNLNIQCVGNDFQVINTTTTHIPSFFYLFHSFQFFLLLLSLLLLLL